MSTTQPKPKSILMPLSPLKSSKIKHCYVPGCTTSYSGRKVPYFYMPVAHSRRRQWMTAIGRPKCRDHGTIYICEDHFDLENDAYFCKVSQITVLKSNAVPIFKIPERIENNRLSDADTGLNSNDSVTVVEIICSGDITSAIDETERNSIDLTLTEDIDPLAEDKDSLAEDIDPLAEDKGTLAEDIDPLAEDKGTIAEDTDPLAEDKDPFAEDTDPLAEDIDPFADVDEMIKSSVTQAIITVNVSPKAQQKRAKLQTYLNFKLTDEQLPPPAILEGIIEIHDEDGILLAVLSQPERENIASPNVLDEVTETYVPDKCASVSDSTDSSFSSDDDENDNEDVGEGEFDDYDDENESIPDVPIISDFADPKSDSTESVELQKAEMSPTTYVNKKLREQLNLLQMGKRRMSILSVRPNLVYLRHSDEFRTPSASRCDTPVFSCQPSQSSLDSTALPVRPGKTINKTTIEMKTPEPTLVAVPTITPPPPPSKDEKRNFIDSLINKLNLNKPTNGEKGFVARPVLSEPPSGDTKDDEKSKSSYDDFLRFPADDTFERSAFVSEELDRFMIENALENVANVALPAKKSHDEAMMFAEAKPPTQVCPQRPCHMEKARTVAEKRLQLEQQTDIKVLMIENELTISRELIRRNRTQNNRVNLHILNDVQDSSIPFTRDCWRLTSWLRTENGRFYYQTFRTDTRDHVKIHSGRGNFARKVIYDLPQISERSTRKAQCRGYCPTIDHIKINNLEILRVQADTDKYTIPVRNSTTPVSIPVTRTTSRHSEPSTPRKLNVLSEMYRQTASNPALLSLKLQNIQRTSLDLDLAPHQLYKMPSNQLQVSLKLEQPLPVENRPHLKTAISHQCLTAEWAAFEKLIDDPVNNMVFATGIDRTDIVAFEVADILRKMIDSVSISICGSAICKIDPDAIVSHDLVHVESNKIVFGRLVKSNNDVLRSTVNCGKDFCKLGCICNSLKVPKTFGYHCKQINCLFECCCPCNDIANEFESHGHNRDMQIEREFTATGVFSKDNSIYILNEHYTRKHNKPLPKLLDDCKRRNEQLNANSPIKTPDTSEPTLANDSSMLEPMEVSSKKTLPNMKKMLEHLRHVSVSVVKLPHLENFEPWCMVHNLYKCFCKLRSIEGEVFKFSEEGDTGIKIESDYDPGSMKRQYTFEKGEQAQLEDRLQKKKVKQEEREIFSSARCRHFDTDMQLARNKSNMKKIRKIVYHEERQRPGLQVLLKSRIKQCCTLGSEKMVSIPERTITKPNLPMQTQNRTTKDIMDSFLRKTMDLPKIIPQKSIKSLCKQPVSNWNQHLLGNRPMTPKCQRIITHLNYAVKSAMDEITSHQRKAKTLSPPTQNLTTLQWCHFSDLFNSDEIYVWKVKLENSEIMLAVTIENVMPSVENALFVINIKKVVMPERLPVLAKLLRLGRLPVKTGQQTVLLYGYTNYWKIIGVMNSEIDYLEEGVTVRPTPVTHPLLASKISKVYDLLDTICAKREAENSNATELPKPMPSTTPTATPSSTTPIPPQPTVLPDKPAQMTKSVSPPVTVPISNIPIVKLTLLDLNKIEVPIPVMGAHRWFMLTVVDDFTHLFIPSWKNYISFIEIQEALKNAAQKQRTLRLSAQASPHIYITNTYTDKIFIGPYGLNDISELALFKEVDATMTRVVMTGTDVEGPKTTGSWLYMKDDVAIVCDSHLDYIRLEQEILIQQKS